MAYHEAGHAVCSCFLPEREELILITIDPSSEAFGMIKTRKRLHHNESKISLSSTISTQLAGRLSEEIFLGTVTTSCIHDLASAHKIAFNMVTKLGMGKNFGLSVFDDTDSFGISTILICICSAVLFFIIWKFHESLNTCNQVDGSTNTQYTGIGKDILDVPLKE